MATCLIVENPHQGQEETEKIIASVRDSGPVPPEGARLVLGGPAETGWRTITVWDSPAAFDRFLADRLAPAYEAAGLSVDDIKRTQFEVYNMVAGDLTGAPQAV